MTYNDDDLRPNTFQFPNVFVDEAMAALSPNEFRVLAYATRRMYGYDSRDSSFGIDELVSGCVDANGTIYDFGAGLSIGEATVAVNTLLKYGFLTGNMMQLSLSLEDTIDWDRIRDYAQKVRGAMRN